ncbi:phage major capsid protein [Nonomuraea sp. K274]|uniref:Phage major capsid protein n=1 Tax=Nonomuraea cypriaca TaxID=1187855 RepID=A0A931A4V0_9ACTN|nr:phage major capsid protein [Nonomuraea cypriaca]MBF8186326.1 phage major capsid protein [Nonomuraea cypriaca]
MAITLAMAQINARDDIDHAVIDTLRRYSWLADQMVWDDAVTPGAGGGTLTYGYTLLKTARGGAFRAINAEYARTQAEREHRTVQLKPFGGSFDVDRVISDLGPAATNEVSFQMSQLLVGVTTDLQNKIINGDVAVDTNGWDGLDKLLVGSSTEYVPDEGETGYADWSTASVGTQDEANKRLDQLDEWLSSIIPSRVGSGDAAAPGAVPAGTKAIVGNTRSIARLRALARWASMHTSTKDDLGRKIETYGDWVLIDAGDTATGMGPIVPVEQRTIGAAPVENVTDLYAITFGLDAFHGATVAGRPFVRTWLPDFTTAGAVKVGELEMGPAAVVLKNSKACGVMRNVKVG